MYYKYVFYIDIWYSNPFCYLHLYYTLLVVMVNAKCTETKTLIFRIPSWTNTATIQINTDRPYPITSGDLHNIQCNGEIKVTLHFPMTIRVQRRYNNAAAIYRG